MKEQIMQRLHTELKEYENQFILQGSDSRQMLEKAYQIVMKRNLVEAVERLEEEDGLEDDLWEYLNEQEEVLEYLYQLWMDCDYSFLSELADLIANEIEDIYKKLR